MIIHTYFTKYQEYVRVQ